VDHAANVLLAKTQAHHRAVFCRVFVERILIDRVGPDGLVTSNAAQIKKGDIVIFTFSHIGLAIEDEKNGSVRTVEGNTSTSGSREGGGVYLQTRSLSLVRSHIRLFA
jgi:hypothetical protein